MQNDTADLVAALLDLIARHPGFLEELATRLDEPLVD